MISASRKHGTDMSPKTEARRGPTPEDEAARSGRKEASRTAVFIAGDKNIFFPAVVAMRSVQVHNPGRYDYFLSFDEGDFTDRMREIVDLYGITFLPSKTIDRANRAFELNKMDGFWPVEINLNWLLPEHLCGLGYAYSIKLDYDILCVDTYDDVQEYWPVDVAYAAVGINVKTWPDEVPVRLSRDLDLDRAKSLYANAGFIVFNNGICRREGFFDRFEKGHHFLIEHAPDVGLREQAALAIVSAGLPGGMNTLPGRYNYRIPRFRGETEDNPDLVNIHYIGEQKPWRPFAREGVEALARRGRGALPFAFPVWLEFASSVEGFSEFCEVRPYTAMDMLDLARTVINEMKSALKAQGRDVRQLQERVGSLAKPVRR